jgi:hypothetical protein
MGDCYPGDRTAAAIPANSRTRSPTPAAQQGDKCRPGLAPTPGQAIRDSDTLIEKKAIALQL